ncbi:uncharacterized protein [Notamacropus eugenii]|uniref:uncharacterized protein n=1 Tax=Notamacropus eugenii TaxID=9315 RepID=UPI003B680DD0
MSLAENTRSSAKINYLGWKHAGGSQAWLPSPGPFRSGPPGQAPLTLGLGGGAPSVCRAPEWNEVRVVSYFLTGVGRGSPGAGGREGGAEPSSKFIVSFCLPPSPPTSTPSSSVEKKKDCARCAPAIYSRRRRRRAHVTELRAADGPLTLLAGEAGAAAELRAGRRRRLQWGFCVCAMLPPPPPAGTRGGKLREKGNPGLLPFPDGGDLFVRTRERDPHIWRTSGDAAARGSAAAAKEKTELRGGWEALAV